MHHYTIRRDPQDWQLLLNDASMTNQMCMKAAKAAGLAYFATTDGQSCYGGEENTVAMPAASHSSRHVPALTPPYTCMCRHFV